jgi:FG-GAP-like repeat/Immunoglobulin domain/S-layer homology domain
MMPKMPLSHGRWAAVFGLVCLVDIRSAAGQTCPPPSFQTLPLFHAGDNPQGIATGDFNNDGKQDILTVVNQGLSVLLGEGGGGFGSPILSPSNTGPLIATGFFDADTDLDVAVTYGSSVLVHLGNGDGTFDAGIFYPGAQSPVTILVGDFDGDGIADIAESDQSFSTPGVVVLLGYGDGTFQGGITSGPFGATAMVAGDFDADGALDVAGTSLWETSIRVAFGAGDGTFDTFADVAVGSDVGTLATSDFDGDGHLDFAVVQSHSIAILYGNGNGTFQPPVGTELTNQLAPSQLLPLDWDGDGKLDIAAIAGYAVESVLQQPAGGFAVGPAYLRPGGIVVAADFDSDGSPDFAAPVYQRDAVEVLMSEGGGVYRGPRSVPVAVAPHGLATADFDGDGQTDFVAVGPGFGEFGASVVLNENGSFRTSFSTGVEASAVAAGNFDADNKPDLAFIAFYTLTVMRNNGDGTFSVSDSYAQTGPTGIVARDLDGDGILDLATAGGELSVFLGVGDGTFSPLLSQPQAQLASGIAADDFDEDGIPDIILTNAGCCDENTDIERLRGNGDGTFQEPTSHFAGPNPIAPRTGDFNEDGHLDLIVAESETSAVALLIGDGDGGFAPGVGFAIGWPAVDVAVADIDGDGHLDIVTANGEHTTPGDSVSLLRGTGLGGFYAPEVIDVPRRPKAVVAASFIPGNHLSIAVASDDAGAVTIFESAELHVQPIPPVSAIVGGPVEISISASASAGLTYQWRKEGVPLSDGGSVSGSQTATLTIDPVSFADAGSYDVVVTDVCGGSVTSNAAPLAVEFADVPLSSPFHDDILTIATEGITGGCGGGNYCPSSPVRRDQMAAFLLKSEHGSAYTPPACTGVFTDVPCPGPFTDWVEQLAAEGVTSGCGGNDYCPGQSVTRAQMAVFLLKTSEGSSYAPPAAVGLFGDVPVGSFGADFIEEIYHRGITGGCQVSPLLYCPGNAVLRQQMATFLGRTFFP